MKGKRKNNEKRELGGRKNESKNMLCKYQTWSILVGTEPSALMKPGMNYSPNELEVLSVC